MTHIVRGLVATLAVVSLAACKDILSVQRPTLITQETLNDSNMIAAMVSGAEGAFRLEYAWVAHAGASQTDEALFSHLWSPWNQFDDRNVTADGGAYDGITYPFLQQARATGEAMVAALRQALGSRAATHAGFARALAYTGYSTLLIADHLCAIPINGSAPKTPDEVRALAIGFFSEAATVATAAGATDIVHLANVGMARASLNTGEKANAISYARKVPAAFVAWARYASNPDFGAWTYYNLYNRVSALRSPSEFNLGYDPDAFKNVRDLRVPFETDSTRRLMDPRAARFAYMPYQPASFSGWTPGGKAKFSEDAGIRFASGLEAQYIAAEAGGMSPAELRTFINARRAAGGLAAFAGSDAQLQTELFEQRRVDFMLAGFRMFDVIRYKRHYGLDLWPKGKLGGFLANDYSQSYGTTECWPIGVTEKAANINIP